MIKYFLRKKSLFFIDLILACIGFINLVAIFYSYSVITDIVKESDTSKAYMITIFVLANILILLAISMGSVYVTRKILHIGVIELRNDIFVASYRESVCDYGVKGSNYYISAILNDVDLLEDNYFRPMLEIFMDSIQIIIMSIAIIFVGWKYFIVVLFLMIPSLISPFILKKQLNKKGIAVSKALQVYTKIVSETVRAFEVIKLFSINKKIESRFKDDVTKLEDTRKSQNYYKTYNNCIITFSIMLLKIFSLLFFVNRSMEMLITAATVALLFGLANNIRNPFNNILKYIEQINSTKEIRNKTLNLINNGEKDVLEKNDKFEFNDKIIAKEIKLSVGTNSILKGFNIELEKGKKYAIIGESGSGKSSFCKLLLGFFDDYNGSIKIDDKDFKDISLRQIYDNISYISQESFVFTDTFRNNIALLNSSYNDEEIMRAIHLAGLDELYKKLPNGLDTIIEADKYNFSGGERQRIAIARLHLSKSNIIILDEATSALDKSTSLYVEKNILSKKDKTVIAIIHKINDTIKEYDKIFIVKNGYIEQSGSYFEIAKKSNELALKMLG
ncbi:MAG: ABC transporter ATP-binding protein/permease [Vallitalea sp.]|jgi:ATP-binding cassette subfamily C protein|nr:ABC transporter ATP-binding protein/permease [Vallitalea sp.]